MATIAFFMAIGFIIGAIFGITVACMLSASRGNIDEQAVAVKSNQPNKTNRTKKANKTNRTDKTD